MGFFFFFYFLYFLCEYDYLRLLFLAAWSVKTCIRLHEPFRSHNQLWLGSSNKTTVEENLSSLERSSDDDDSFFLSNY
ncbi:expressed protein [Phakopsora pachyrhizi]|uniref:Expressed protein n=1 Tax=Phakopsora pachyrhizi TaxID=170000 RepID=A0AAV0B722_PHAPC|nr:expressed protein [Phakopsora pachyrhizi]